MNARAETVTVTLTRFEADMLLSAASAVAHDPDYAQDGRLDGQRGRALGRAAAKLQTAIGDPDVDRLRAASRADQ